MAALTSIHTHTAFPVQLGAALRTGVRAWSVAITKLRLLPTVRPRPRASVTYVRRQVQLQLIDRIYYMQQASYAYPSPNTILSLHYDLLVLTFYLLSQFSGKTAKSSVSFSALLFYIICCVCYTESFIIDDDARRAECAPGCKSWMLNDRTCDVECNNSGCNWDEGDCGRCGLRMTQAI